MEQPEQVVYVDNEPFLGRRREQDLFREMLDAIRARRDDDAPPFIILIHGVGGIGKSHLTRRLRDLARSSIIWAAPWTRSPPRSRSPACATELAAIRTCPLSMAIRALKRWLEGNSRTSWRSKLIRASPRCYFDNQDKELVILHSIRNAPVAHTDPVQILVSNQFLTSTWPWVAGQSTNCPV
jgi:hypothetical protein